MGDWSFTLTHALTIGGWLVTIGIAYFGFRTFERWRREKLEEKRIDIAIEALALAYETQEVFRGIRSAFSQPHEWKDMPRRSGETDDGWNARGPYYAILKRVQATAPHFENLEKLRPRYMAIFDAEAAKSFMLVRQARAHVIVSAQTLVNSNRGRSDKSHLQMECDIWDGMDDVHLAENPQATRVKKLLLEFQATTETLCRPIVDRSYQTGNQPITWRDYLGF